MKLERTIGSLSVDAVLCLGNGLVAHSADARRVPRVSLAFALLLSLGATAVFAQGASDANRWGMYEHSRRFAQAAHQHLRDGQLSDAMEVLGQAADLDAPVGTGFDNGLSGAAGGWHRHLAGLDSEERYELLREWSMPTESRRTVRVLTSIVPTVAPPSSFARALGERPRRESFAVAKVGDVAGLFCSGWLLVRSARDARRLRQLTTELEELSEQQVPHAKFVLTLARLAAGSSRGGDQLAKQISEHIARSRAEKPRPGVTSATVNLSNAVIAAACMDREALQPVGENILKGMIERSVGSDAPLILPFLRTAHAIAIQNRYADAKVDVVDKVEIPNWIVASRDRALLDARGAVNAIWLSHEDHILHLAGPMNDYLLFRFPLDGEFEFSCEALDGGKGRPQAGVGYDGQMFGAWGGGQLFKTWDVDYRSVFQRSIPFVPNTSLAKFQRLAINSAADGITTFSVNGHPVWSGSTGATSPWIALRSYSDRTPVYRNFRITGTPRIPREVRLSDDDTLRGWLACYYADSAPEVLPTAPQTTTAALAWYGKDGVIHGSRIERELASTDQSRLSYVRPLQNGESISYEFLYEAGRYGAHPAVGRLAFLIEPDGVRLHWMTTGDSEWTGLPDDNAVVEPFNRRGPKPLPLLPGDWNRVTVAMVEDTITLLLNDAAIYSHKLKEDIRGTFSFYHDRNQTEAQIRHVVLRGDWPETLPRRKLDDSASISDSKRTVSGRRVLSAIFDEIHIADAAISVHRRATRMPAEERYRYLTDWVLPGVDHDTIRLTLDFTPTHPAPPVAGEESIDFDRLRIAEQVGQSRVQIGGQLVAPAIDLVEVAKELSRLDQLRERIANAPSGNQTEQRSRLAMLSLIDLARDDLASASRNLEQLSKLVEPVPNLWLESRWPETLAIWMGLRYSETREIARDMAAGIVSQYLQKWETSGSEAWDRHMSAMVGLERYLHIADSSIEKFSLRPPLSEWAPVGYATAKTRGMGFPISHWELTSGRVENLQGHDQDYLYYHIPLRGDFEIECDATVGPWAKSHLMVAGTWFAPFWRRDRYESGTIRDKLPEGKLTPPMVNVLDWIHYRIVVRDGLMSVFFDGRKVHEQALPADHDPWIAIRSWCRFQGGVKNLQVSGDPIIPDTLKLAATRDLSGWYPYFEESVGAPNANWKHTPGGIVGRRRAELAGSGTESVLYYQRPMLEDGTIEYEFYYQARDAAAHPVLDRMAMVLAPGGVRIHWITDGKYDRSGLSPLNEMQEPLNRRGPDSLPLVSNSWNRVQLKLIDDTVHLTLNDELVYRRKLEATNQRTFGLFHDSGQTEARVRNIVWRGDWPQHLPVAANQELAGKRPSVLDMTLPRLTSVYKYNFTRDGWPQDRFAVLETNKLQHVSAKADGVHVALPGSPGFVKVSLSPRLVVAGDFDITASFDDLNTKTPLGGASGISLKVVLDSMPLTQFDVYRGFVHMVGRQPRQLIQSQFIVTQPGGLKRDWLGVTNEEATSGTLRLARRGETVYCLFAEEDSPVFRLCGTEIVGDDDVRLDGIRLITATHEETGSTNVIWKQLTIRAEGIRGLPVQNFKGFLAEIDKHRDALPDVLQHDFAKDKASNDRFERVGTVTPWQPNPQGLRLVAPGSRSWRPSGLSLRRAIRGDFDIAVSFDTIVFEKPPAGGIAAIYLRLALPGATTKYADAIHYQRSNGRKVVVADFLTETADGLDFDRLGTQPSETAGKLRIVRRGEQLLFLFARDTAAPFQMLAQANIGKEEIPTSSIQFLARTIGEDHETVVSLKSLELHADKIVNEVATGPDD